MKPINKYSEITPVPKTPASDQPEQNWVIPIERNHPTKVDWKSNVKEKSD